MPSSLPHPIEADNDGSLPVFYQYDALQRVVDTQLDLQPRIPRLLCIGGVSHLKVFAGEYGQTYEISAACSEGIAHGTVLRVGPSCDNASVSQNLHIVDVVVGMGNTFVVPRELSFVNGKFPVCIQTALGFEFNTVARFRAH